MAVGPSPLVQLSWPQDTQATDAFTLAAQKAAAKRRDSQVPATKKEPHGPSYLEDHPI